MKRFRYSEPDYAFGQLMLTLRIQMGLTQARLAERLSVSRRTVSSWELGSNYPASENLKEFIALAVQLEAWAAGREAEEIRSLWRAAHQKVLLDESWLAALLGGRRPALTLLHPELQEAPRASELPRAQPTPAPLLDWGEALDVPSFYGRESDLATLVGWVVEERCRLVSVMGQGGIGKSALVVRAMRELASHFDVVFFRSLRDAPECSALLESCLAVLAPEQQSLVPESLERRLSWLLSELRRRRVLLVLDNLEVLLEAGEVLGRPRPGYEGYGQLLEQIAHTAHQSCLLLTSREQPAALRALEGSRALVRSLRLAGLSASACAQLLAEHELTGSHEEQARLAALYAGNPLALGIVAETIADLFGGAIEPFLSAGTILFGSITHLLEEQWERLSALEQTLLSWLAIQREPVSIADLNALLVARLAHGQVLEAVDGLRRRSLVERGQRAGSFTLQSVVLEFVTGRLVEEASEEIQQGRLALLLQHGLSQAQAKEYVRESQERLLLAPLLERLENRYRRRAEVEERVRELLSTLRAQAEAAQGYGPANLVALLLLVRGHLRGLDLSRLALRGAFLQGVQMQDANLSGARLCECVWTETFDAIFAVAISSTGQYWAVGSKRGEVRVWREAGQILHRVWQAHTDIVPTVAFSPDGRRLSSGSFDGSVKLWDVESGVSLWSDWQAKGTICLTFSPDGGLLASGGLDATLRLWDPKLGTLLEEVPHPHPVIALAWSPDGHLLASGDFAGTIRLWQKQPSGPTRCVKILSEHSSRVRGLAFAPDGSRLASASWDGTVKLWDLASGRCLETLAGHSERVHCVAWSPDGGTLASGSLDHTIRLWEVQQGRARVVLQGHTDMVNWLAFTPDSRQLLSGSDDGTLRLWDVQRGESLRVLRGYTASLYDVEWSPDGTQLASAGADTVVSLWNVVGRGAGTPRGELHGHSWSVYGVAWRPDGSLLASAGREHTIRLWNPVTGACVQILQDRDHSETIFSGVAWSPDGHLLAGSTFLQGVLVWDVTGRSLRWVNRSHATWVRCLAFSPDGTRVVGGGDDGHVYVWEASDGTLLLRLAGHHGVVTSVAWSPDGSRLATSSGSSDSGELVVWDALSGARVRDVGGHPGVVSAVTWSPSGEQLISGGSDGILRWWNVHSGECLRVREAHRGMVQALKVSPDGSRLASCGDDGAIVLWDLESGEPLQTLRRDRPYERLNITGIRGLSEAQKASLLALGAFEETSVGGEMPARVD
jgi:WD40 repeat protein/transcriptional regulator with XRE-family HTH domain